MPQPPTVTVTATTPSPGEHLLNGIALRILACKAEHPPDLRSRLGIGRNRHHAQLDRVLDGFGDVIGALQAAGALPPRSLVPGQLAVPCASRVNFVVSPRTLC